MKRLLPIFFLLLVGCSVDSPEMEVVSPLYPQEDMEEDLVDNRVKLSASDSVFQHYFTRFVMALINKNKPEIQKFINTDLGVYMTENNGAMPLISKTYLLADFKLQNDSLSWIYYIDGHSMLDPFFESLPKVICDKEIYDKQGCFVEETNPLLDSQIWNYANLNEKEIQAIEVLVKTIQITVVSTSNCTFYFSKIEEEWYLTFLDLRVPCSA